MSLRTDIPWPNISGASSRYSSSGCSTSQSYSEFNNLGTSAFSYIRTSSKNSCCGTGFNDYATLNNYYGCGCHGGGRSNWFTKFMTGFTAFSTVAPAVKSVISLVYNLFSGGSQSTTVNNIYNNDNAEASDNKVYVEKTIKKFVKTEDGGIKIVETKQKVQSPDGSNKPILEIVNEAGVELDKNNEIVYEEVESAPVRERRKNSVTGDMEWVYVTKKSKIPKMKAETTESKPKLEDVQKLSKEQIDKMSDKEKEAEVAKVVDVYGCTEEEAAKALGLPPKEEPSPEV